jgi:hypothetical protein
MSKDLMDIADERGVPMDCGWIRIAFNEILGSIYHSKTEEKDIDLIIEKLANILFEKTSINEENIDWEKLEKWHLREVYSFITYETYFDFEEAKEIICKSKVSPDYDWEDISSNAMDIEKIHEKMIKEFIGEVEVYGGMEKELLEQFTKETK